MLLLDEIIEITECYAVAAATVRPDWPLTTTVGGDPLLLVELAAETAGVCNSWNERAVTGKVGANKGWLVGVKQAEFYVDTLAVGSRIIIRSENTHKYDVLREISSTVLMDKKEVGKIILQLIKAEDND